MLKRSNLSEKGNFKEINKIKERSLNPTTTDMA